MWLVTITSDTTRQGYTVHCFNVDVCVVVNSATVLAANPVAATE